MFQYQEKINYELHDLCKPVLGDFFFMVMIREQDCQNLINGKFLFELILLIET